MSAINGGAGETGLNGMKIFGGASIGAVGRVLATRHEARFCYLPIVVEGLQCC